MWNDEKPQRKPPSIQVKLARSCWFPTGQQGAMEKKFTQARLCVGGGASSHKLQRQQLRNPFDGRELWKNIQKIWPVHFPELVLHMWRTQEEIVWVRRFHKRNMLRWGGAWASSTSSPDILLMFSHRGSLEYLTRGLERIAKEIVPHNSTSFPHNCAQCLSIWSCWFAVVAF